LFAEKYRGQSLEDAIKAFERASESATYHVTNEGRNKSTRHRTTDVMTAADNLDLPEKVHKEWTESLSQIGKTVSLGRFRKALRDYHNDAVRLEALLRPLLIHGYLSFKNIDQKDVEWVTYREWTVNCPNQHPKTKNEEQKTQQVAKVFLPLKVKNPKQVELQWRDLVYSSLSETLDKGKLRCQTCGNSSLSYSPTGEVDVAYKKEEDYSGCIDRIIEHVIDDVYKPENTKKTIRDIMKNADITPDSGSLDQIIQSNREINKKKFKKELRIRVEELGYSKGNKGIYEALRDTLFKTLDVEDILSKEHQVVLEPAQVKEYKRKGHHVRRRREKGKYTHYVEERRIDKKFRKYVIPLRKAVKKKIERPIASIQGGSKLASMGTKWVYKKNERGYSKDLIRFRVIARDKKDCYRFLDYLTSSSVPYITFITEDWSLKDYIAQPKKDTRYQSLHISGKITQKQMNSLRSMKARNLQDIYGQIYGKDPSENLSTSMRFIDFPCIEVQIKTNIWDNEQEKSGVQAHFVYKDMIKTEISGKGDPTMQMLNYLFCAMFDPDDAGIKPLTEIN